MRIIYPELSSKDILLHMTEYSKFMNYTARQVADRANKTTSTIHNVYGHNDIRLLTFIDFARGLGLRVVVYKGEKLPKLGTRKIRSNDSRTLLKFLTKKLDKYRALNKITLGKLRRSINDKALLDKLVMGYEGVNLSSFCRYLGAMDLKIALVEGEK